MILEFLEKLFPGMSDRNSRQEVKNRLKLVLAHDRAAIAPEMLEAMRREILEVVSRYVDLDSEAMEFSLDSSDRMTILVANLPIRKINPQFYTVKEATAEAAVLPEITLDESLIGETAIVTEMIATETIATETIEPIAPGDPVIDPESTAETAKERLETIVVQDSNETGL
jgi:cell division topological specificity factor